MACMYAMCLTDASLQFMKLQCSCLYTAYVTFSCGPLESVMHIEASLVATVSHVCQFLSVMVGLGLLMSVGQFADE